MLSLPGSDDVLVAAVLRQVHERPSASLIVSPRRHATVAAVHTLAAAVAAEVATRVPERAQLVAIAASSDGPAFLVALLAVRLAGHAALLLDAAAPVSDRTRNAQALGAVATLECPSAWPESPADFRLTLMPAAMTRAFDGIAVVKLTSGSTGAPRGVAMSAATALADESALAASMEFRPDDRLLATVPLSHSYGFTTLALTALVRGLPLVVADGTRPFEPLRAALACGATVFPTAPAYLGALLAMNEPPPLAPSVRLVISAGALLSPSVAERFRRTYGRGVHTLYGSSECGGICYDRTGTAAERGAVGTAVKDVRIELVPGPDGDGAGGLVVVHSPAVAATYLPAPDPRLGAGRFETADLAEWRDGELVLRGRAGQTINIRGRKVEPAEVEHVIRRLAGVDDVVVLGVSSPHDQETVRAVVAGRADRVSDDDIRTWCRQHLAQHKVPRSILLVDAIRYTSRGKVDPSWLAGLRDTSAD